MAGNIAAAQAYIADITTPETRARGMGLFGAAFGLGFIVGPSIGALLAVNQSGAVDFTTPLLVASGTSVFAAILVFVALKESLRPRAPAALNASGSAGAQRWFGPIVGALRQPGLAVLVILFFLVVFAFSGLESTFALWAERQLAWGPRNVGYMFAGIGVVMVVVQGGLIGPMTKRLGETRVLLTGVVGLSAGFILLPAADTAVMAAAVMALLAAGFGLANPSLQSLVSRSAAPTGQGAALGVAQSAASLSRIFGPIEAGALFHIGGRALPYFVSAGILIAVAVALMRRARLSPPSRSSASRS
jgi:DHA1 family tetracycline resistance protein-like MFS transporter